MPLTAAPCAPAGARPGAEMSFKAVEREEAAATPRTSVGRLSFKKDAMSDVNIPLASLPEYVQEKLAAFDKDGDGNISLAEILHHGAELERTKQSVAHYRRLVAVLLLAWAVSMAAIFGVVTAGVAVTRQTVVTPGSALMMTRDGTQVVQTGAARQTLSQASSSWDDSFWQELTHMSLVSSAAAGGDSWVRLGVVGTARIQGTGSLGSVIQVLTSAGSITFDDTAVTYSSDIAPLLTEVGIVAAAPASGRRLLLQSVGAQATSAQTAPPSAPVGPSSRPSPPSPPPRAPPSPPPRPPPITGPSCARPPCPPPSSGASSGNGGSSVPSG